MILVPSLEECGEIARRMSRGEMIEREQAAGAAFGPMHRQWQLERAPERVHRLLRLAMARPDLVAGSGDFAGPQGQFPGGNMAAAINTTVTETNLWNPGLAPFFIGANTLRAGMRWQITFGGVMGTTATPTIVWTARVGTSNAAPPAGTSFTASPTVTLGTFTGQPFIGMFYVGVRAITNPAAASTVMTGTGWAAMPAAAAATTTPHAVFGGAVLTTVDQTAGQGLGVSIIWGASSASNTLTCEYADPWVAG